MVAIDEQVEEQTSELQRSGDVQKCPVCGSHVDSDAYHCPKCRNYFCFHCRARLLASDSQYQCINKVCDYYGKLLCGVCDHEVRKEEAPAVYIEPEDGYWPLLLIGSLVLSVLTWIASSFSAGLLIGLAAFGGGAYALHRAGVNVFGRENEITQPRSSVYHTCICCQQPVREIQESRPRTPK
jgi:hypothetical protein